MPTCPHCGFQTDDPRDFQFWEDNFFDKDEVGTVYIKSHGDPTSRQSYFGVLSCPDCDMVIGGIARNI